MKKILFTNILFLFASFSSLPAANLFIEAESFAKKGGWVVDQQFMDLMGSSYLMAHGMGEPVEDAQTEVTFPEKGTYYVYVRTYKERIMYMYGHITGLRLGKMEKDRENSACMSVTRSWLHLWDAKEIHGCGKQQGK